MGIVTPALMHTEKPPEEKGDLPPMDDLVLLLFCPEQGGWHTGVRFEGRWLAHISTEIVLRPTHWLPAPADPPGFDQ